jgi:hypothetical protein
MDKRDYVNETAVLPLGKAKDLRIKSLGIVEMLAMLENKVLAAHRADIAEMAKSFEGKTRADYIIAERKQLPQGDDLAKEALDFMGTLEGVQSIVIKAITKSNDLTPDDVLELFKDGSTEEFSEIFNVAAATLLGDDEDDDDGKPPAKKKPRKKRKKNPSKTSTG